MEHISTTDNTPPYELVLDIKDFYTTALKEEIEEGFLSEEDFNLKSEGEVSFYKKVLDSVEKATQENQHKKIIVLFDIDETLVSVQRGRDSLVNILRPSATALLSKLKEKKVTIGFLTSRAELEEQLGNELKELNTFIDREYLFSTRKLDVYQDEELKMKNSLPDEMKNTFVSGDYNKMKFLNQLHDTELFKDRIFIPVDDFKYPVLYPYGVALHDKEKFFI